jgi:hypothetical protein
MVYAVYFVGKIDFDQWFSPSAPFIQDAVMSLDRVVTGTASSFQFNSASFYPLNGQLLGASNPSANNQYFTMEVREFDQLLRGLLQLMRLAGAEGTGTRS